MGVASDWVEIGGADGLRVCHPNEPFGLDADDFLGDSSKGASSTCTTASDSAAPSTAASLQSAGTPSDSSPAPWPTNAAQAKPQPTRKQAVCLKTSSTLPRKPPQEPASPAASPPPAARLKGGDIAPAEDAANPKPRETPSTPSQCQSTPAGRPSAEPAGSSAQHTPGTEAASKGQAEKSFRSDPETKGPTRKSSETPLQSDTGPSPATTSNSPLPGRPGTTPLDAAPKKSRLDDEPDIPPLVPGSDTRVAAVPADPPAAEKRPETARGAATPAGDGTPEKPRPCGSPCGDRAEPVPCTPKPDGDSLPGTPQAAEAAGSGDDGRTPTSREEHTLASSHGLTPEQLSVARCAAKKPGGVVGFNKACLPKDLTPVHLNRKTVSRGLTKAGDVLAKFEYHMYGSTFNADKKRPLAKLLHTGDQVLREGVKIQCVEACFVALLLTQGLSTVTRFALSFESRSSEGKTYRHLVLALRFEGKYGSLGISRNQGLMTKPVEFPSLWELLQDFVVNYQKDGHSVRAVTLSKPIPVAPVANSIHWSYHTVSYHEDALSPPETEVKKYERRIQGEEPDPPQDPDATTPSSHSKTRAASPPASAGTPGKQLRSLDFGKSPAAKRTASPAVQSPAKVKPPGKPAAKPKPAVEPASPRAGQATPSRKKATPAELAPAAEPCAPGTKGDGVPAAMGGVHSPETAGETASVEGGKDVHTDPVDPAREQTPSTGGEGGGKPGGAMPQPAEGTTGVGLVDAAVRAKGDSQAGAAARRAEGKDAAPAKNPAAPIPGADTVVAVTKQGSETGRGAGSAAGGKVAASTAPPAQKSASQLSHTDACVAMTALDGDTSVEAKSAGGGKDAGSTTIPAKTNASCVAVTKRDSDPCVPAKSAGGGKDASSTTTSVKKNPSQASNTEACVAVTKRDSDTSVTARSVGGGKDTSPTTTPVKKNASQLSNTDACVAVTKRDSDTSGGKYAGSTTTPVKKNTSQVSSAEANVAATKRDSETSVKAKTVGGGKDVGSTTTPVKKNASNLSNTEHVVSTRDSETSVKEKSMGGGKDTGSTTTPAKKNTSQLSNTEPCVAVTKRDSDTSVKAKNVGGTRDTGSTTTPVKKNASQLSDAEPSVVAVTKRDTETSVRAKSVGRSKDAGSTTTQLPSTETYVAATKRDNEPSATAKSVGGGKDTGSTTTPVKKNASQLLNTEPCVAVNKRDSVSSGRGKSVGGGKDTDSTTTPVKKSTSKLSNTETCGAVAKLDSEPSAPAKKAAAQLLHQGACFAAAPAAGTGSAEAPDEAAVKAKVAVLLKDTRPAATRCASPQPTTPAKFSKCKGQTDAGTPPPGKAYSPLANAGGPKGSNSPPNRSVSPASDRPSSGKTPVEDTSGSTPPAVHGFVSNGKASTRPSPLAKVSSPGRIADSTPTPGTSPAANLREIPPSFGKQGPQNDHRSGNAKQAAVLLPIRSASPASPASHQSISGKASARHAPVEGSSKQKRADPPLALPGFIGNGGKANARPSPLVKAGSPGSSTAKQFVDSAPTSKSPAVNLWETPSFVGQSPQNDHGSRNAQQGADPPPRRSSTLATGLGEPQACAETPAAGRKSAPNGIEKRRQTADPSPKRSATPAVVGPGSPKVFPPAGEGSPGDRAQTGSGPDERRPPPERSGATAGTAAPSTAETAQLIDELLNGQLGDDLVLIGCPDGGRGEPGGADAADSHARRFSDVLEDFCMVGGPSDGSAASVNGFSQGELSGTLPAADSSPAKALSGAGGRKTGSTVHGLEEKECAAAPAKPGRQASPAATATNGTVEMASKATTVNSGEPNSSNSRTGRAKQKNEEVSLLSAPFTMHEATDYQKEPPVQPTDPRRTPSGDGEEAAAKPLAKANSAEVQSPQPSAVSLSGSPPIVGAKAEQHRVSLRERAASIVDEYSYSPARVGGAEQTGRKAGPAEGQSTRDCTMAFPLKETWRRPALVQQSHTSAFTAGGSPVVSGGALVVTPRGQTGAAPPLRLASKDLSTMSPSLAAVAAAVLNMGSGCRGGAGPQQDRQGLPQTGGGHPVAPSVPALTGTAPASPPPAGGNNTPQQQSPAFGSNGQYCTPRTTRTGGGSRGTECGFGFVVEDDDGRASALIAPRSGGRLVCPTRLEDSPAFEQRGGGVIRGHDAGRKAPGGSPPDACGNGGAENRALKRSMGLLVGDTRDGATQRLDDFWCVDPATAEAEDLAQRIQDERAKLSAVQERLRVHREAARVRRDQRDNRTPTDSTGADTPEGQAVQGSLEPAAASSRRLSTAATDLQNGPVGSPTTPTDPNPATSGARRRVKSPFGRSAPEAPPAYDTIPFNPSSSSPAHHFSSKSRNAPPASPGARLFPASPHAGDEAAPADSGTDGRHPREQPSPSDYWPRSRTHGEQGETAAVFEDGKGPRNAWLEPGAGNPPKDGSPQPARLACRERLGREDGQVPTEAGREPGSRIGTPLKDGSLLLEKERGGGGGGGRLPQEEFACREHLELEEGDRRQFASAVMRAELEGLAQLGQSSRKMDLGELWSQVRTKREFKKCPDFSADHLRAHIREQAELTRDPAFDRTAPEHDPLKLTDTDLFSHPAYARLASFANSTAAENTPLSSPADLADYPSLCRSVASTTETCPNAANGVLGRNPSERRLWTAVDEAPGGLRSPATDRLHPVQSREVPRGSVRGSGAMVPAEASPVSPCSQGGGVPPSYARLLSGAGGGGSPLFAGGPASGEAGCRLPASPPVQVFVPRASGWPLQQQQQPPTSLTDGCAAYAGQPAQANPRRSGAAEEGVPAGGKGRQMSSSSSSLAAGGKPAGVVLDGWAAAAANETAPAGGVKGKQASASSSPAGCGTSAGAALDERAPEGRQTPSSSPSPAGDGKPADAVLDGIRELAERMSRALASVPARSAGAQAKASGRPQLKTPAAGSWSPLSTAPGPSLNAASSAATASHPPDAARPPSRKPSPAYAVHALDVAVPQLRRATVGLLCGFHGSSSGGGRIGADGELAPACLSLAQQSVFFHRKKRLGAPHGPGDDAWSCASLAKRWNRHPPPFVVPARRQGDGSQSPLAFMCSLPLRTRKPVRISSVAVVSTADASQLTVCTHLTPGHPTLVPASCRAMDTVPLPIDAQNSLRLLHLDLTNLGAATSAGAGSPLHIQLWSRSHSIVLQSIHLFVADDAETAGLRTSSCSPDGNGCSRCYDDNFI
ncbi:hypothetical protein DIPPA_21567 [Diplonema papillatum]|nr:hypothetical protein DIPPA_21567 [Diplonema papillatum]